MRRSGEKLSGNVVGILLMVAATLLLTSMSTMVRSVSADLHPFVIAFFRNLFGLTMLMPILMRQGLRPLRTRHLGFMALRGAFNASAMLFYFLGLGVLPLAELSALSFTAPLFIVLLAAPILNETLGARRIACLVIGFSGALIIVRPGVAIFNIGALYALASAASWAVAVLVIKHVSRSESSVTITIYGLFFLTLFTLPPALLEWAWPSPKQFVWLAVIAAVGTAGQLLLAQALKRADASLVMPFDFTKLIWAALLGFLVFAEVPTVWTWIGAAVIFASAFYSTYRERAPRGRRAAASDAA